MIEYGLHRDRRLDRLEVYPVILHATSLSYWHRKHTEGWSFQQGNVNPGCYNIKAGSRRTSLSPSAALLQREDRGYHSTEHVAKAIRRLEEPSLCCSSR